MAMDREVAGIIIGVIKERNPEHFAYSHGNSYTDIAGNRIHVHDLSIVWETRAWLDYEVLDIINERLEFAGYPVVAEYAGDYEITIERLNP
jgi:hypothetical protein